MRRILVKTVKVFLIATLLLSLFGCHKDYVLLKEYYPLLANKMKLINDDPYIALKNYGLLKTEINGDDILDYELLSHDVTYLVGKEISIKKKGYPSRDEVNEILDKYIELINHKEFKNEARYVFKYDFGELGDNDDVVYDSENNKFYRHHKDSLEELSFDEMIDDFSISSSEEISFDNAKIKMIDGEEITTEYQNNKYNLLSSSNTFIRNYKGYRISLSLMGNGISAHVSKKNDNGTLYTDLSISDIKPNFKIKREEGKIKEAYYRIDFKTNNSLGFTSGRYKDYYPDLEKLEAKDFMSLANNLFKSKDEVKESITLAKIETPIASIPFMTLELSLKLHFYVGGKIELALTTDNSLGFEMKNGAIRIIADSQKEFKPLLRASGKMTVGTSFAIKAIDCSLADILFDAGVGVTGKTIIHLYDENGDFNSLESDLDYSLIDEAAANNGNIKVCADFSIHLLSGVKINQDSLLAKAGLAYEKNIWDEDDAILGLKKHLENGQFVEKCTVNKRSPKKEKNDEIIADKISIKKYALIIKKGESLALPIESLPSGYQMKDLLCASSDSKIASVSDLKIIGSDIGTCRIKIYTSDLKYECYITVLVSNE